VKLAVFGLTILGLLATIWGALKAARAVMLSEEQAVEVGTTKWASNDFEVNRKLPLVKSLRAQSHSARVGLWWVAGGSVLQAFAAILALFE
jgi:hypothetical protein